MPAPPFGIRRQRNFINQAVPPGVVPSSFAIEDLDLEGYWPDEYTGDPEVGAASAGDSGGRNLIAPGGVGLDPPSVGTALNGYDTSDYDGTDDLLESALTVADFCGTGSYSFWVLFNADTAATDLGAGSRYLNPQFIADSLGYLAIGFSDAGVHFFQFAGGGVKEVVVACGTAGWHLAQGKYDGVNMSLRVDSGSRSTLASDPLDLTTGTMKFGSSFDTLTSFYDGKMANKGLTDFAFTDQEEDDIKDVLNTKYGLAL